MNKKEIRICKHCGKEINVIGKALSKTKFCVDCRKLKWILWKKTRNWENSSKGKEYAKEYQKKYTELYKKQVYDHYGWKCACCGETLISFLTLDHVDNDGFKERHLNVVYIYKKIIKENFPDNYQILCMNCNWSKRINHGICEHKLC
jgi:hypothetical protein